MSTKKTRAIFQLRATLRDIEPPIWRRVQVPEDTRLPRLHRILQLLFNWEDYHLHDFVVDRRIYSVPDPDDAFNERKVSDERLVPLNQIVDHAGGTFEYAYDFGDDWQHDILHEAILLPEAEAFYPWCVAGARNGPPEDAGGPSGYADYLEALADPEHEEHENMLPWRGPFDPEALSLDRINASLRRTFHRRAASKRAAPAASTDPGADHLAKFMLAALRGEPIANRPAARKVGRRSLHAERPGRSRRLRRAGVQSRHPLRAAQGVGEHLREDCSDLGVLY